MRIALYGPTGAGKSTLAESLRRIYGLRTISTGEFIRREFPNDPLTGGFSDREKQILEYVERELLQDNLVLDGFPRHIEQAKWLFGVGEPISHVFLPITAPLARKRILLRGRADMSKFDEQYAAQSEATRLMHDWYHTLPIGDHFHAYGTWEPEAVAKWIYTSLAEPNLLGKEQV